MFFCRGCDRMRDDGHIHRDPLLMNFEKELSEYEKKMKFKPLVKKFLKHQGELEPEKNVGF